jgi:maltose O-acetyltransferase
VELLRRLLGGVGEGAHFEPVLRCEFGSNITVGANFYANFDCVLLDGGGITIGDNVLFGPRVSLYTSNHAADAEECVAGGCYARPISVGDNTWIGGGVTVNPGVSIGRDAIVGSGSVVTRSVPDGCLAAGVPARVIRKITAADRTGYRP